MFRKNHILFALVMSFSASAFALVGGPFDNGDYSELLDQNGIYQWVASMPNGLGEGQFSSSVNYGATVTSAASSSGSTTNLAIGSVQDRAIFYYKGVTFFGQCMGIVDLSSKTISCITNGSSEVTISASTTSSTTTGTSGTTSGTQASSTVVTNGNVGFVCNSEWNGNITETNPTLEFHGTGQFSVINGDAAGIVAGLAQQIVSSSSSTNTSLAAALNVITGNQFVNSIQPQTIASVQQGEDSVNIDVTGSRKYFLGQ